MDDVFRASDTLPVFARRLPVPGGGGGCAARPDEDPLLRGPGQRIASALARLLIAFAVALAALATAGNAAAATVELTAAPSNLQLYPRDSMNGADVVVAGSVTAGAVEVIRLTVTSNGVPTVYEVAGPAFSFEHRITAGLHEYEFLLETVENGVTEAAGHWTNIVSGDVFVIQGQSNAEASPFQPGSSGEETPFIRSFGTTSPGPLASSSDRSWYYAKGDALASPGAVGQWGIRMANLLSQQLNIPIAVFNGARGGMPIAHFQRNDANPNDVATNYGRLRSRLEAAGVLESVKGLLWYQGESDLGATQVHISGFSELLDDWRSEFGTNIPGGAKYFVFQIRSSCGFVGDLELKDAQRLLSRTHGVTVLSTTGLRGHDGCHFNWVQGYKVLGEQAAATVLRDLYDGPSADVSAPDPLSVTAEAVESTQLTVQLNSMDELTIDPGVRLDFRLEGNPSVSVTNVEYVSGGKLLLTLSGPVGNATGLSYLSRQGIPPMVRTSLGVGMLIFRAIPINFGPVEPPSVTLAKALGGESGTQPGLVEPGETLTYHITLTNEGGVATDFAVEDHIDPNTSFVSADNGGAQSGGVVTWTGLTVPGHDGTNPGTLVLTVVLTATDPLPIAQITNIAKIPGDPDPACPSAQCVVTPAVPPPPPEGASLDVVTSAVFVDKDGNGHSNAGDVIVYTFTVTNTGNVTLRDVSPADAGPMFGGRLGQNGPLAFTPAGVLLAPGQVQQFRAEYVLAQGDVDNAAGIEGGVENRVKVLGYVDGGTASGAPAESEESLSVLSLPSAGVNVSVAKVALLHQVPRGGRAPFQITLTNHSGLPVDGLKVIDMLPSGFRHVEGSATVEGVPTAPVVDGRRVAFEDISVPGNGTVSIRLDIQALSSAGPGEYVNRASATDSSGLRQGPEAAAAFEILADPVFDCSGIIGQVFDDRNRNGHHDEGERGLPGTRIGSVGGLLVTTDAEGRFGVPCAELPVPRLGKNFIMKLDARSLPSGYRLTTENPRVVRLTTGKVAKLNFGASINRVVRFVLRGDDFEPGSVELLPSWVPKVNRLLDFLRQEPSVLRLAYTDPGSDPGLAQGRLRRLAGNIRARWRQVAGHYRLEIEMQAETGR